MKVTQFVAFFIVSSFIFSHPTGLAEQSSEVINFIPSILDYDFTLGYKIPKGWTSLEHGPHSAITDPHLTLSGKDHHILIDFFGGKGALYETVEDFMKSPQAQSDVGRTKKIGVVTVSGKKAALYHQKKHLYPPPHLKDAYKIPPEGPHLASEEFCIVPFGERFFVFRYGLKDYFVPSHSYRLGRKMWIEFLRNVSIVHMKKEEDLSGGN